MTDRTSNGESNRDKVLRGEVVKVTDDRLREMQRICVANEGVGYESFHWHWAAVVNELIERRAVETTTPHLLDQFTAALKGDPDLAWSWHCNLAMPIMDRVKCSHTAANEAAADLMRHLFHIDIRSNSCWAITVQPEEPLAVQCLWRDGCRNERICNEMGCCQQLRKPHDWFASAALGYKHCVRCAVKWMSQDEPEPIGCPGSSEKAATFQCIWRDGCRQIPDCKSAPLVIDPLCPVHRAPEKAREHHPRCELMQPHGHEPPKCTCSGLNGTGES